MNTDDSWPMIEEAVFRLFDEIVGKHVAIGPQLADLGWSDIEAEYRIQAWELLFRAQGRFLAQTDCLDRLMLAELAPLLDGSVQHVVLPDIAAGDEPGSVTDRVTGIVLGPLEGRLVVPVPAPMEKVSVGIVDAGRLHGERADCFDASVHWTRVSGALDGELIDASTEWHRAIAAAHRALATELVAVADQVLRIAVSHAKVRVQFGSPIGSFQSPRHALAEASAIVEGARALVSESWRSGTRLSAHAAKVAGGRAHRTASDVALQVCGAIGLTAEHELHRYVARGFQIDSLCGSYQQLEAQLADSLFNEYSPGQALPAVVAWN